jgi:hydrogenase/urease accessory protein HupE
MIPASNFWRAVVLLTAALAFGFQASTAAHDPGLSALDVRVLPDRIVATLSLAPGDARLLVSERGDALEAIALDSIEVVLDGARLPGRVESRGTESETGGTVVLAFDGTIGSRLTVRSSVPASLARGHRELLTVRGSDGASLAERMLDDRDGTVNVTMAPRGSALAGQFFALGLHHILTGYDHLVFLAALLLGVRRLTSVVTTVTSFTVAHSLTLGLAVLGFVRLPAAIVEPLIAASIVVVGLENLLRNEHDSRWKLTFAFGLVHGFGFAGALQELGIGAGGIGIAVPLGAFNAGVEVGQIAVATTIWPFVARLTQAPAARFQLPRVCSLLVVAAGAYWLVARIVTI